MLLPVTELGVPNFPHPRALDGTTKNHAELCDRFMVLSVSLRVSSSVIDHHFELGHRATLSTKKKTESNEEFHLTSLRQPSEVHMVSWTLFLQPMWFWGVPRSSSAVLRSSFGCDPPLLAAVPKRRSMGPSGASSHRAGGYVRCFA